MQAQRIVPAEVVTAVPLSDASRAALTGALAKAAGAQVTMTERVDPGHHRRRRRESRQRRVRRQRDAPARADGAATADGGVGDAACKPRPRYERRRAGRSLSRRGRLGRSGPASRERLNVWAVGRGPWA